MAGDGTQGCISFHSLDAQDTIDTSRNTMNNSCFNFINGVGDNMVQGAFSSMDADGFTLAINVMGLEGSRYMNYIAIGGIDATVKQYPTPTVTGEFAYTGVAFQPDAGIFVSGWQVAWNTYLGGDFGGIGFCDTDLNQFGMSWYDADNVATTVSKSAATRTQAVLWASDAYGATGQVISWDADGFTLRWDTAYGTNVRGFLAILVAGGEWHVDTFTAPTTSSAIVRSGYGLTPDGLIVLGAGTNGALDSVVSDFHSSFGATDGVVDQGIGWAGDDAQGTSNCSRAFSTDEGLIYVASFDGASLDHVVTLGSLDVDGVTLNVVTVSSVVTEIGILAFGEPTTTTTTTTI
jgi:hypothetical protein